MGGDGNGVTPCGLQFALQFIGKKQVSEFALSVSGIRAVALFRVQIVKINAPESMGPTTQRDNPRLWRAHDQVEQQTRQGKVSQMIYAKLCLEILFRLAKGRVHDACVVDEQVQTVVVLVERLGEAAHRVQVGQVELHHPDGAPGLLVANLLGGGLAFLLIAAGHDDGDALLDQGAGCFVADAAIGTGDDRNAAGLIGNVICCPIVIA